MRTNLYGLTYLVKAWYQTKVLDVNLKWSYNLRRYQNICKGINICKNIFFLKESIFTSSTYYNQELCLYFDFTLDVFLCHFHISVSTQLDSFQWLNTVILSKPHSEKPSCFVTQWTFTCSKSTIETLEKVWNMFKVNNKGISASIVDSEHVNVCWEDRQYFWAKHLLCFMISSLVYFRLIVKLLRAHLLDLVVHWAS